MPLPTPGFPTCPSRWLRGTCWSSPGNCWCHRHARTLVEKRRFIAGPARGVELGFVRRLQCAQVPGNQLERFCPGGFHVMVGGCVIAHRVRQAALVLKPVVGLLLQRADAVLGKEGRVHRAAGGFPVDRLGAVFAELDHVAFRRLAPGTARAVEAAVLVGLEHGTQVLEGVVTAQPALGHAFSAPSRRRRLCSP